MDEAADRSSHVNAMRSDLHGAARCTGCGREIVWARAAASGKRIPLDPIPCDDGNVIMLSRDSRGTPQVRVLKKIEVDGYGGGRYKAHFATCVATERYRRAKE